MPVIFFLFALWTACLELKPANNQPPSVNLTLAGKVKSVKPGQQVPFLVSVTDPEDGSSDYQEIAIDEVFVEIRYIDQLINNGIGNKMYDPDLGIIYIKEQRCFDCHQWKTDLVGPAFGKIKQAYDPSETQELINAILNGSVGRWGNEMMPAQDIPLPQAQQIVSWLLGKDPDNMVEIIRGLDGLFVADFQFNHGYYLLTASYRDHGVGEEMSHRKTGYHHVVLEITD
jgi:cytochrome c551/c552